MPGEVIDVPGHYNGRRLKGFSEQGGGKSHGRTSGPPLEDLQHFANLPQVWGRPVVVTFDALDTCDDTALYSMEALELIIKTVGADRASGPADDGIDRILGDATLDTLPRKRTNLIKAGGLS
ncbi:hypothetical protein ACFT9I_34460 [Streptomyces sp. NPDC057137]|uniref:hypothetical protein n=1 Tax=Streptomyces sp. NPDC057137 TaxID=3346030 RepID=UPI00362A4F63